MRFSFHTHSTFCDGKAPAELMAETAMAQGYSFLGFSSHAPVPFQTRWNLPWEKAASYVETIRSLAVQYEPRGMRILLGMETDYAPGITMPDNPAYKPFNLDYRIGSVHYIAPPMEGAFTVDEPQESFARNVARWCGTDHAQIWKRYWLYMCEMIERGGFDIIGHFDLVKKNNADGRWFDPEDQHYLAAAFEAVDLAADKGLVAEINTGSIARGTHHEVYPSAALLKRMRERGMRLTIGDDAHAPSHLGHFQHAAVKAALQAGFRSLWYLERPGCWKEFAIGDIKTDV